MTIAAVPAGPPSTDGVAWRTLASGLRVARRDGRHLGTVQKGRHWLATGVDGDPIGSFRSLREAQAAVAAPALAAQRAPARHTWLHRSSRAVPALAIAALGVAALLSTSGWVWTALTL